MAVNPVIEESWKRELAEQFASPYFEQLKNFLLADKSRFVIYPPGNLIFNAFNLTPFEKVKVVIIGQDPYHEQGQAHGLSFSVQPGTKFPPSLVNIFQELQSDIGMPMPKNGNLESWARQGVLLLNAILTVRAQEAGSHQNRGWEIFTDAAITALSAKRSGIVFLLWGVYAQKKIPLIDTTKHFILTAPHPSPLSAYRGWFGCKHFSKTNDILIKTGQTPIDWRV